MSDQSTAIILSLLVSVVFGTSLYANFAKKENKASENATKLKEDNPSPSSNGDAPNIIVNKAPKKTSITHPTAERLDEVEKELEDELKDCDLIPEGVDLKMVIGVRTDLNMSKGKIAAQVGHGVLYAYKIALRVLPEYVSAWEFRGQAKITLKLDDEAHLDKVKEAARAAGLPYAVIEDAGRTEIEPGTRTVIAIGPAPKGVIDQITGPKGSVPLRLFS